jgi:hypothetical protein
VVSAPVSAFGGYTFDSSISGNQAYAYGGGSAHAGSTTPSREQLASITDVYSAIPFGFYDLVEHPDGITAAGYNHITVDPQLGPWATTEVPRRR